MVQRLGIIAAVLAVFTSGALPAHADPTPADKAMATQLYDDAEKLTRQHDYDAACPKLRESNRLDPQLGTLLHLADCYEKQGRTASAWAAFKDGAEIAAKRGDAREKVARKRAAALEAQLARLTIEVPGPQPGTEVRLDGEVIGRALWGSPAPIDPGAHHVTMSATGRQPRDYDVTVPAAGQTTLTVQAGAPVAAPTPAPPPPARPPPAKPKPPPPPPRRSTGSGHRTLGYVVGGVGIAGVAVGAVAGALVLGKKSTINAHCDGNHACDAQGLDSVSSARTLATVSTVGFIVGAVGVGAGAYLLISGSGEGEAPTTALSTSMLPGGAGLSLLREF